MGSKFFEELSRCLGKEQIESLSKEDRRLEIFLHGQPVLSVSPGNEVFMLPSGSKNPEANELYHRVAIAADRVFEYHLLAEDPNLNDKQIRAIQEARIKIEFSVPDLDTQLEHRQDYSPQMEM